MRTGSAELLAGSMVDPTGSGVLVLVDSHKDVLEAMEQRAADTAARMADAVLGEIPVHAAVADPRFAEEVLEHSRRHVDMFVECARRGRPPAGAELDFVRERGAQRARELLPLEAVLHSYLLGQRLMWEAVVEAADGDDGAALALTATTFEYAAAVNAAVAEGWTTAASGIARDEERARRDVLDRLLSGDAAVGRRAATLGLDAEEPLVVVVAAVQPAGDEQDSALRAVTDALARAIGPHHRLPFVVPRHDEVVALVPSGTVPASAPRVIVDRAVAALARAGGPVMHAGLSGLASVSGDIAGAYEEARRALRHASADRPVVVLDEVALTDELVATVDAATKRTVPPAVMALRDHPDLAATLTAFADNDLNIARTAAALHVHTNTVQYRLGRIEEVTGLNPRRFGVAVELVLGLRVLAAPRAQTR